VAQISGQSIVLYAEFTARPGQSEVVAALVADLAKKVRQEEGNLVFDCYRRSDDSSRFFVYEVYRDDAAFQVHISSEYGAVFNARLQELIVEPNSVLTFLTTLPTNLAAKS